MRYVCADLPMGRICGLTWFNGVNHVVFGVSNSDAAATLSVVSPYVASADQNMIKFTNCRLGRGKQGGVGFETTGI